MRVSSLYVLAAAEVDPRDVNPRQAVSECFFSPPTDPPPPEPPFTAQLISEVFVCITEADSKISIIVYGTKVCQTVMIVCSTLYFEVPP